MVTRRTFLLSSVVTAIAGLLRSEAAAQPPPEAERQLAALLNTFFDEWLTRSPEGATWLKRDTGAHADARARLDDRSLASVSADRAALARRITRLRSLERGALTGTAAVDYDSVLYAYEAEASLRRFPFGGPRSPYLVSQRTGAYRSVPNFLDTKHSVASASDADTYLSRLQAFATALDQETERVREDGHAGVRPPDFIIDQTLEQLQALASEQPAATQVVRTFAEKVKRAALNQGYVDRAARLYVQAVQPALDRQYAALQALRAGAGPEAGVWRLPDGEAYYAARLRAMTTTSLSADEIYRYGLERQHELTAMLDPLLKAQGLSQDSVGARLKHLSNDPRNQFPNTEAGRAEILAAMRRYIEDIRPKLPRLFGRLPKAPLEIRRPEPAVEPGASFASYFPGAPDGSEPFRIYVNLSDTSLHPRWGLGTTAFHEGMPGHHLQISLELETPSLAPIRQTLDFLAYVEGWALYAEQLADELGVYDHDPLGRIGYLAFALFRACRLVIDTGLHNRQWGREQAAQYLTETAGRSAASAALEIDRYTVDPGQACTYAIGYRVWTESRRHAEARLGASFSLQAFHDAGLFAGSMPLDVLARHLADLQTRDGGR